MGTHEYRSRLGNNKSINQHGTTVIARARGGVGERRSIDKHVGSDRKWAESQVCQYQEGAEHPVPKTIVSRDRDEL